MRLKEKIIKMLGGYTEQDLENFYTPLKQFEKKNYKIKKICCDVKLDEIGEEAIEAGKKYIAHGVVERLLEENLILFWGAEDLRNPEKPVLTMQGSLHVIHDTGIEKSNVLLGEIL